MMARREWFIWLGAALATLPVVSFALQAALTARSGMPGFYAHYTVVIIDWVFVPFNFLVVQAIDWRRGRTLLLLGALSLGFNCAAHAYWQSHATDAGYMFSAGGTLLPAGWVHLVYSTLQMVLLSAFVFARRAGARCLPALSLLAVIYFLAAGASGYIMNRGFMLTDVAMVAAGLSAVLVYPRLAWGPSIQASMNPD
jgi:hypothetical protein